MLVVRRQLFPARPGLCPWNPASDDMGGTRWMDEGMERWDKNGYALGCEMVHGEVGCDLQIVLGCRNTS